MATQTKTKSNSGRKPGRPRKNSPPAENKSPAKEKKAPHEPDHFARGAWGTVFLLLSILSILGLMPFREDTAVLDFLRQLHKGMVGAGWWLCGFVFFSAAVPLLFDREYPVRLRVVLRLMLPYLWGALSHAMMGSKELLLNTGAVASLYHLGSIHGSGGVLGGLTAQLFMKIGGRLGAALMVLVLLAGVLMALFHTTPGELWGVVEDFVDEQKKPGGMLQKLEERRFFGGYDPEPEEEKSRKKPAKRAKAADTTYATKEPVVGPEIVDEKPSLRSIISFHKKQKDIDIGLDGEEENLGEPLDVGEMFQTGPTSVADEEYYQQQEDVALDEAHAMLVKNPRPKRGQSRKAPPEPLTDDPSENETEAPPPLMKKEKVVADTQIQHDLVRAAAVEVDEYITPSINLLKRAEGVSGGDAGRELRETRDLLMETITSFGINGKIVDTTRGPSVTRYELALERGIKLSKVTGLARDIALSLGAVSVRIAPIPGKNSVVGIEVPNKTVSPVSIRSVLESNEFRNSTSSVSFAVGKDISNRSVVGDIARMPHLLIAGTTGSGKSVCTNSMIISLLYKSSPKEVRLIMVDPKMVELSNYNGIPHLLIPVVTDPKKAAGALQWAVFEMMQRYQDFANHGVREIESYNALMRANPEMGEPKPKIVVFIDELADLMIAAAKEVEESICRVAQMGRAAGMHLVIATQRPSSDVITGLMKANIPSRIALAVASAVDSRIILDSSGAEDLVGNGDMLFSPLGKPKRRVQGCYISDGEVNAVIDDIKRNCGVPEYSKEVMQQVEENARRNEKGSKNGSALNVAPPDNYGSTNPEDDHDPLFYDAVDIVVELQMASASTLQRKLKVGYSRAGRIIDEMEEFGYVGPFEGSKPRKVNLSKEQWSEKKMQLVGKANVNPDLELARMMSEAASLEVPPFDDAEALF